MFLYAQTAATKLNFWVASKRMFNDDFGIVAELNYTALGEDYSYTYSGTKYKGSFNSDAVELPLLLKFAFSSEKGVYAIL